MGGGVDGVPTRRAAAVQYHTHDLGALQRFFEDRCVTPLGMETSKLRRKNLGVIDVAVAFSETARNITIKRLCGS